MSINSKLVQLRKKVRLNQKKVIDEIIRDHSTNTCIFCGSSEQLTKEHVIPQWVYSRCTKRTFVTTTNGASQTYNKTTLPACKDCNSNILGSLERHLKHEFENIDVRKQEFSRETYELIILWLETLEYKFQVLDLRRNLNKVKGSEYIPYIGKMPISMFQGPADTSPSKVFSNLRSSLKALSVKSKSKKLNSLCVLYTKNPDFHFFHSSNNFIFIELAQYGVAFFYFFNRTFDSHESASLAAQEIVKKEYAGKGT
ncbi:HNH endonuclease [Aliivibrio fischeri]|uniref:HNH endonuclease n=1 Tax=Aliivibrio fischeri TaxID=668 RepID=UPI001F1FA865|nr:HNH endonuclease [Aliivibrio fischeri]MCE7535591.1 HNH endonuclease [Aliivibrio fischeri]MCE7559243.1 HNH endonuclease [Aliivibrio fischeri]MCE7577764.1 HNH endonuclease [Aliivibrio fischeri]MCE7591606.1 HNH endonuclease [Aliivibrio fischeri]